MGLTIFQAHDFLVLFSCKCCEAGIDRKMWPFSFVNDILGAYNRTEWIFLRV